MKINPKKIPLKEIWKMAVKFTSLHTPEILTAVGITGMFTSTVLAVKSTPKALDEIKQKEFESIKNEFSRVLSSNKELFSIYNENKQKYEEQNVPELEKKQKQLENSKNTINV